MPNIYYTEYGSGTETIIFSHGLIFNHHQWDEQVDYLKEHSRCIAYDHRGQGQSVIPRGHTSCIE